VELKTDFFDKRDYWKSVAKQLVYTGPIDQYFNYRFGRLTWRSIRCEAERIPRHDYQGISIMNYATGNSLYAYHRTQTLYPNQVPSSRETVIIREYPHDDPSEPYYPSV
jgi:UDP-galactopyranose mutase